MDAEQRLRAIAIIHDDLGNDEGRDASLAGADALALLRELPERNGVGYCVYCTRTVREGHTPSCLWHKITALLTRAGRA